MTDMTQLTMAKAIEYMITKGVPLDDVVSCMSAYSLIDQFVGPLGKLTTEKLDTFIEKYYRETKG